MTDLVRKVTLGRLGKDNQKVAKGAFKTGDTIGVHVRVKEGDKERIQLFKGVVLKVQGSGMGRSFTVRKMSSGVGVERTFPFASPMIDRIEVLTRGKVRRSRLYFLRNLRGKAAKIESELVIDKKDSKKA